MKFSEIKPGVRFRQGAPGTRYGLGGKDEHVVFVKLKRSEMGISSDPKQQCGNCHSDEVWSALNVTAGIEPFRVHFCPESQVWPL